VKIALNKPELIQLKAASYLTALKSIKSIRRREGSQLTSWPTRQGTLKRQMPRDSKLMPRTCVSNVLQLNNETPQGNSNSNSSSNSNSNNNGEPLAWC